MVLLSLEDGPDACKQDDPSPCLGMVGDVSTGRSKQQAQQCFLLEQQWHQLPGYRRQHDWMKSHDLQTAAVEAASPALTYAKTTGEEKNSLHWIASIDLHPPRSTP